MPPRYGTTISEEAAAQIDILSAMFRDEGLEQLRARYENHPAVVDYINLAHLAESPRSIDLESTAASLATMLFDRSNWAEIPDGDDFWLALVGNQSLAVEFAARIEEPDQYRDTLAELFTCGWLRTEGFDAELEPGPSMPDICIDTTEGPVWAEVKRIRTSSRPRRVADVMTKANRQIKVPNPDGAGVLFLSFARLDGSTGTDDEPPPDVSPFLDLVSRRLHSGQLRSIARVVASWDDWIVLQPTRNAVSFFLRRRSLVFDHDYPRAPLPFDGSAVDIGLTAMVAAKSVGTRPRE